MYYGWAMVAAGAVSYAMMMGACYASFGLFVMPVSEEFGLGRADTNMALVLLSLGISVLAPFLGRLVDKVSIRRVMAAGGASFGLALVGLGLSHSLWLNLAILVTLLPLGVAAGVALTMPVLVVRWFSTHTARAMVITQMGVSLGGALIPPLAAILIEWQGWRTALIVLGIGAGTILSGMALLMRDWPGPDDIETRRDAPVAKAQEAAAKPDEPKPVVNVGALLRNARFWIINVSGALVIGFSTAFTVSLAPLARGQGLSLTEAATLISVMSTAGIAGKVLFATFGDRIDNSLLLSGVYATGAAGTAVLAMTDQYLLMLVAVAPLGLMGGVTSALLNVVVADHFGRASFGTVTGLAQPIQSVASMVAIRYAGEVFDRTGGYDLLLITIVAVKAAASVAMLVLIFGRRWTAPRAGA